MILSETQKKEREKYIEIRNRQKEYGGHGHYREYVKELQLLDMEMVCDMGTGDGSFPRWAVENGTRFAFGIDWVSSPAWQTHPSILWIEGPIWTTDLLTNTINYVTAFDVLEHLTPDMVKPTLAEMHRICRIGAVLSISYLPAASGIPGTTPLHMTVRTQKWWDKQLTKFFTVDKQRGRFWILKKKEL